MTSANEESKEGKSMKKSVMMWFVAAVLLLSMIVSSQVPLEYIGEGRQWIEQGVAYAINLPPPDNPAQFDDVDETYSLWFIIDNSQFNSIKDELITLTGTLGNYKSYRDQAPGGFVLPDETAMATLRDIWESGSLPSGSISDTVLPDISDGLQDFPIGLGEIDIIGGQSYRPLYFVAVITYKGSCGVGCTYRESWGYVQDFVIMGENYCQNTPIGGSMPENRGDAYCWTKNRMFCDDQFRLCKDPCPTDCNGICLKNYAPSPDALKRLMNVGFTDLCTNNPYICNTDGRGTEDCIGYVQAVHGADWNNITHDQAELDSFAYSAHCEMVDTGDLRIEMINDNNWWPIGKLGVCKPSAQQPQDCHAIFGESSNINYLSPWGDYRRGIGWGVTQDGKCVVGECANSGDCGGKNCIGRQLKTSELQTIGVCPDPTINADQCQVDADCLQRCNASPSYNPLCLKGAVATINGTFNVCQCLGKPPIFQNCMAQTEMGTNAYCMFYSAANLPLCKKLECQGTALNAQCVQVEASCTVNEDCYVGEFTFGKCTDSCCDYTGYVPPPPSQQYLCPPFCDQEDYLNLFALLLGLIVGSLTAMLIYIKAKSLSKGKRALIAILGGAVAGVITYYIITLSNIQVGNPFDMFTPHYKVCGNWIVMPDLICEAGNFFETIKWVFSIAVALIGTFFLAKFLNRVPDLQENMALKVLVLALIGAGLFILAGMLFWLALGIAVVFLFLRYIIPYKTGHALI